MARTTKRSRKRPARERKHAVRAQITVHELTKTGTSLTLEIGAAGEKIGQMVIGRSGRRLQKNKRLSWSRFAELMDKLAYGGK